MQAQPYADSAFEALVLSTQRKASNPNMRMTRSMTAMCVVEGEHLGDVGERGAQCLHIAGQHVVGAPPDGVIPSLPQITAAIALQHTHAHVAFSA